MSKRLTACEFCGYPISEAHHPYKVSIFGQNQHTIHLCANCHEFYHLVEDYAIGHNRKAKATLDHLAGFAFQGDLEHFIKLIHKCMHYIKQVQEAHR